MPEAASTEDTVALFVGLECPYCPDGELQRGTYKNNDAAICDGCGTPGVQVW